MNQINIPQFVSAKTAEGLIEEMRGEMIRLQMRLHFYSITFANGRWYAWYDVPLSREIK